MTRICANSIVATEKALLGRMQTIRPVMPLSRSEDSASSRMKWLHGPEALYVLPAQLGYVVADRPKLVPVVLLAWSMRPGMSEWVVPSYAPSGKRMSPSVVSEATVPVYVTVILRVTALTD